MKNSAQALATSAGQVATIPLEGRVRARLARHLRARRHPPARRRRRSSRIVLLGGSVRAVSPRSASTSRSFAMTEAATKHASSSTASRRTRLSFFRGSHHFDFLGRVMVPELVERARRTGQRKIRIWSAACSTGPAPWTIALVLREALGSLAGWDIRILASDLDTNVLQAAEQTIYDHGELADVPDTMIRSGFESSRMVASAWSRRCVSSSPSGASISSNSPWPIRTKFNAVFGRNVAIYFESTDATGPLRIAH